MRILFLHQNFPAQFGQFGQYLAANGWDVVFGTERENAAMPGIRTFNFKPHRGPAKETHPYAGAFEKAVLTGQSVARAALALKNRGFNPDIVVAHSGWGPGLFIKDIWPATKFVGYFEWYYSESAPDLAFLPDTGRTMDDALRTRTRNAPILLDLASSDAGICPTSFQRAQFPACFHEKLSVIHDGIDTEYYSPEMPIQARIGGIELPPSAEIITYVARGMEPYRGFPEFMRALEIVLAERPRAHALIAGEDRVAYGRKLPGNESYRKIAERELDLDWSRVHFTGLLPRTDYRSLLRASDVHVYLTIPFVLSWSMLEAMSAGCAIVASDVEPVREIASQNPDALRLTSVDAHSAAAAINAVLDDRTGAARMGAAARQLIMSGYSAAHIFPSKMKWLSGLAKVT